MRLYSQCDLVGENRTVDTAKRMAASCYLDAKG